MKYPLASKKSFTRLDLLNSVIKYGLLVSYSDEYYSPIHTKTLNMRNQLFMLIVNSTHIYECEIFNGSRYCGKINTISQVFLIRDTRDTSHQYVIFDPLRTQSKYPFITKNSDFITDVINQMIIFRENDEMCSYNLFTADISQKDKAGASGAFRRYKSLNSSVFGNFVQYCYNTGEVFDEVFVQRYAEIKRLFIFPFHHSTYSAELIRDVSYLLAPFIQHKDAIIKFLKEQYRHYNVKFGITKEIEFYEHASYFMSTIFQLYFRSTILYKKYKFIPIYGALTIYGKEGSSYIIPHHFAIMKIGFAQSNSINIQQCAVDFFGNEFVSEILESDKIIDSLPYGPYDAKLNNRYHCLMGPITEDHSLRFDKYQEMITKFYQEFILVKKGDKDDPNHI